MAGLRATDPPRRGRTGATQGLPDVARTPVATDRCRQVQRRRQRGSQHQDVAVVIADFEGFAKAVGRLWKAEIGSAYVPHQTIAEQIDGYTAILQRHQDIERGSIPRRRRAAPAQAAGTNSDASAPAD